MCSRQLHANLHATGGFACKAASSL